MTVECKPPAQEDGVGGLMEVASEAVDQYNRNAIALAMENSLHDIGQKKMVSPVLSGRPKTKNETGGRS